jgi:hypothetical protein
MVAKPKGDWENRCSLRYEFDWSGFWCNGR